MTLSEMIASQRKFLPITLTPDDVRGKTYIVTGANIGLGYECVKHLVALGAARVIIAVRTVSKGEDAKRSILASVPTSTSVLDVWHLDLTSYESVKQFAKRARDECERLDGVVQNAAVAMGTYVEKEGRESGMTTNVFSTLLLTLLLIPKMRKTGQTYGSVPNIAIIGSGAAFHVKDTWDNLDKDDLLADLKRKEQNMAAAYPLSKLILHMAYTEMARRMPPSKTGVVVNHTSPGLCNTNLTNNAGWLVAFQVHLMRFVMGRTAEKGSRTLLYGLAAGEESHGRYMSNCEIDDDGVPEWAKNEEARKAQVQLWEGVSAVLEDIEPGCVMNVYQS